MNTMDQGRAFTLDDLCALSDLPKRTVRYYIQINLVDNPIGETRAAYYTAKHLDQLLRIRTWTQAGVSLERIRELLAGDASPVPPRPRGRGTVEVWSHMVVSDGLEISLEPGRAGLTPEQVRAFFKGTLALYDKLITKE